MKNKYKWDADKYFRYLFDNGIPIDKHPKDWKLDDFTRMQDLALLYPLNPIRTERLFDEVEKDDHQAK